MMYSGFQKCSLKGYVCVHLVRHELNRKVASEILKHTTAEN